MQVYLHVSERSICTIAMKLTAEKIIEENNEGVLLRLIKLLSDCYRKVVGRQFFFLPLHGCIDEN